MKHDLICCLLFQNSENKKEILCDEKLKKVFVHDKITIHEVVKSMSPHISKKNE